MSCDWGDLCFVPAVGKWAEGKFDLVLFYVLLFYYFYF